MKILIRWLIIPMLCIVSMADAMRRTRSTGKGISQIEMQQLDRAKKEVEQQLKALDNNQVSLNENIVNSLETKIAFIKKYDLQTATRYANRLARYERMLQEESLERENGNGDFEGSRATEGTKIEEAEPIERPEPSAPPFFEGEGDQPNVLSEAPPLSVLETTYKPLEQQAQNIPQEDQGMDIRELIGIVEDELQKFRSQLSSGVLKARTINLDNAIMQLEQIQVMLNAGPVDTDSLKDKFTNLLNNLNQIIQQYHNEILKRDILAQVKEKEENKDKVKAMHQKIKRLYSLVLLNAGKAGVNFDSGKIAANLQAVEKGIGYESLYPAISPKFEE